MPARPSPELLAAIAENLDRQMQVSVRARTIVHHLYRAARERQGDRPLSLLFANRLLEAIQPGDIVLVNTGWLLPGFDDLGESDGPLGAAILARALALGLKAKPLILIESPAVRMMEAVCWAAGLAPLSEARLREHSPSMNRAAGVASFPIDPAEAERETARLLDDPRPAAVLAIEKNGRSRGGGFHMLRGYERSAYTARADLLFDGARRLGVPTLAIGDLGNELGMGLLEDVVHEQLPVSRTCKCPCASGSADATPADVVLVAENSNLGAYAAAACLAAALGRPDLIHDAETETRLLTAAAQAGAVDGAAAQPIPAVDGMPAPAMAAAVSLLRHTVQVALEAQEQEPFYFGLE